MKPELAAGFLAAAALHALLLFGFGMATPARPLALSDEPSHMDVSLVAAPPEPAPAPATAAPTPAEPAPTPEPVATPEPIPTPEPQPTPDVPTPPPEPSPDEEAVPAPQSTPAPNHQKTLPRHRVQSESRTAAPHSAPGAAAALAGAASRGATGGPLSSRASYRSNPKPDYPPEARRQRQEGVVLISVEVDADGRPVEVSLARSSGFPLLDEAAVQAVRRWTFEPARAGGLAVSSHVEVPVRFSLAR
jgi:protein TonB